ncbi:DNA polymerase III subunit epsilon [Sphingosinicellaceae bacterium]|nr:DNA polymerase III subunit epsilon [Sphingosinicellaceae bacterium]
MDIDDQRSGLVADGDDDVRILRRLRLVEGPTGLGDPAAPFVGVVIDCETTGLDHEHDEIIELALRRFRYDAAGIITKIDRAYSWLQEPSAPIPHEVTRITGLTDAAVAGHRLDDNLAVKIIASADYRIGHNAGFDRKFVERRLPTASGLAWACSCVGIDWKDHALEGRSLGWLVSQIGWFYDAHRATADVDAVIALLTHVASDGRTALSRLIERAELPSWVVRAIGANFEVKDQLKARGYGWDPVDRVWAREVPDTERMAEEFWLARNIYSDAAHPRVSGPAFFEVTSLTRYR